MKVYNADWGWFIGNFEPSVLKTPDFEVGYLIRKEEEGWHYHQKVREYNYLIYGTMWMHNQLLTAPRIFILEPWEIANPVFQCECHIICVKVPSMPEDKYEIK